MKRAIGYGIVVLLLAFAVGCKKDKKKEGETPATDDKAGEATPTDTKAGEATPPAGGEATPPAGGEATPPAGGGTAMAPADMCKKIEEMATKEGGKAKETWDKNLKSDCEKEMNEAKTKDEAKYNEFVACVQGKATLTEAMESCKQIN